mmetsp:Transcript_6923/g.8015  ORF Transcript_6923/g.8015 Transcript_6923/m.8015 type:complete len:781 (+) Transcript_6923:236-2578(+)
MSSSNLQESGGPPAPIYNMRRSSTDLRLDAEADGGDNDVIQELKQRVEGVRIEDGMLHKQNNKPMQSHAAIAATTTFPKKGLRRGTSTEWCQQVMSATALPPSGKPHEDPPARERPLDGIWPERDALSFTRFPIFCGAGSITEEHEHACRYIMEARSMRQKYHGDRGTKTNDAELILGEDELGVKSGRRLEYRFGESGVVEVFLQGENNATPGENLVTVPSIDDFMKDYKRLEAICCDGAMRSFCFQRLQMLSSAFKMHATSNGTIENEAQSNLLGTDFYRTMKIDNHIHLAAAASAKQFVSFVEEKLKNEGDTIVTENGQTLKDLFDSAGLSVSHMTIDAFNILADYSVYQRFDNFNSKYSPFRLANMRNIFLKVENCIEGRYFAELTKTVLSRLEQSKGHNSASEMRLSIYGMERHEWLKVARWILRDWEGGDHPGRVLSSHNRWLVQVPRLWRKYCAKGGGRGQEQKQRTFQDMLENLFCPIFEATLYPEDNPEVAELLKHIVGFDSVDDEGSPEGPCCCKRPSEWKSEQNPTYSWQLYYLWANITVLNKIRKSKGLNTFSLRPHAGETGDVMHLAATYILCQSINHGINLDRQVSLQYLYYLDQVGLSISPLSNNFLFRKIASNPFPKLFKRGLNVTLSTDDPLLFHMSDDALLEEYSVARASFDLSMTDVSEIARNSVLQSDFEDHLKKAWLGGDYKRGVTFCDETKTHVPLIRAKFRAEHLAFEHMVVNLIAAGKKDVVLKEMMVHFGVARDAYRNILMQNLPDVESFPEQNQL